MQYIAMPELTKIIEANNLSREAAIWDEIREAAVEIPDWKNPENQVPPKNKVVLTVINGQWKGLMFSKALVFATFDPDIGWELSHYPECRSFNVLAWMDMPDFPV